MSGNGKKSAIPGVGAKGTQAKGPQAAKSRSSSVPAKETPGTPPGLHRISTPLGKSGEGPTDSDLMTWAKEHGIADMVDGLLGVGVTHVTELATLTDEDLLALFSAVPSFQIGDRSRLRLAMRELRKETEVREQESLYSDWVEEDSGMPVPRSLLRGAGLGGPEAFLFEDHGVGMVQDPKRGWLRIGKMGVGVGRGSEEPKVQVGVPQDQLFHQVGPLAELERSARQFYQRLEGASDQVETQPVSAKVVPSVPKARPAVQSDQVRGLPEWAPAVPVQTPESGSSVPKQTPGGRLVLNAGIRAQGTTVALKVERRQAPSIWEEWTGAGSVRMQEAVCSKNWRSADAKNAAFDLARALDVMSDSGLDVCQEPSAEVMLRALAAAWFADRHPKESATADWLRESSMGLFGVPRSLLEEARASRKLMSKASSDEA